MVCAVDESQYRSLALTRRLLERIKEGVWDEAEKLESKRFGLIQQELSIGPNDEKIEEKIKVLREIEGLNSEIERLLKEHRSSLAGRLQQIAQGRRAGRAYQKNRGY